MSSKRLLMNYAEDITSFTRTDQIRDYYHQQAVVVNEDIYNHIVILLTMCINKELHIALSAPDDDITSEMYPQKLLFLYDSLLNAYMVENSGIIKARFFCNPEHDSFLSYLNHMVECLLSGIHYIEKCDELNELNTQYRREERIRDNMKHMISTDFPFTKFTISHHIEIPYMYVLAWDLEALFRKFDASQAEFDDKSYIGNLRRNTGIELRYIGTNLIDILLYGQQRDRDKPQQAPSNGICDIRDEYVDYTILLPTISIVEHVDGNSLHDFVNPLARINAEKNHTVPYIKKEVLKQIPLLPMKISKDIFDSKKALKFMIKLMIEENKTRDYEESDLVYFKNCITDLCTKIIDLIWRNNDDFTRIGPKATKQYLDSISEAVNTDPRKNSPAQRNMYIFTVTHQIVQQWDFASLHPITVQDNNQESYIQYAYFSVLKLARNWISHSGNHPLFQNPSMQFCVFLFLIAARYVVNLSSLDVEDFTDYLHIESKLFKILNSEKYPYSNIKSEELDKEYLTMYRNVYKTAGQDAIKKSLRFGEETKDPHSVLTAAGHADSNINASMSENEIFLAFWLCIHMGKNNTERKLKEMRDGNLYEILERTFKYQKESHLLMN